MLFWNRKLRKLKQNPHTFFVDMLAKKKWQLRYFLPRLTHSKGFASYTIVSACYNVENYLDKFFSSLIRQTLSFKKNIFCIMVDDGSTDGTATIIKKWQTRYPENIIYLRKKNDGQASARNLGMQYVSTPWVTFTDPDDFLDPRYFQVVDDFLRRQTQSICMIGTRLLFYFEDKKMVKENHPLDFKFRQPEHIISVARLDEDIQLSAATAFFRTETLRQCNLKFDEKIKPNFEDAHFIAHYLDREASGSVAYLSHAIYFYRKRTDKNSSLDKSWQDPRQFYDTFIYGKLDILKKFSQQTYIQYTILYDLLWHFKYLIDRPEKVAFLTKTQKEQYLKLLDECFSYISEDTIRNFNLADYSSYYKIGLLHSFKRQEDTERSITAETYDPYKQEVRLCYFTATEPLEEFFIDNEEIIPTHAKTVRHDFLGRTFCLERLLWLPLFGASGKLRCRINGKDMPIALMGHQYKKLFIGKISQAFCSTSKIHAPDAPWLFFDRDTQADDNAEHLYRWILHNHPERKAYFVLKKNSHDWCRLKQEGFRLIAHGSSEHEACLHICSKLISSHIDSYIFNYFGSKSTDSKQFCWLQHGVTKDDLSHWINKKKNINILISETPAEYNAFIEDGNRYRLTDKEVKLLGFPRHDALLASHVTQKRQLLIMPTWRFFIAGNHLTGSQREKNPEFMQTDYAKAWSSVLQSLRLRDIAHNYCFDIVFFPHANIQPYLDEFKVPDYIRIMHHCDGSIQNTFHTSTVMLTDYSSVAFEMAYLYKSVIYYQFDEDTFFNGNHIYQKGYFDYRQHGFGPVATDEDSLMHALDDILSHGGQPAPAYQQRMRQTFVFRDGKNCERVYKAICAMDSPNPAEHINTDILISYIITAIKKHALDTAQRRITLLESLWQNAESRFLRQLCNFHLALSEGRLSAASTVLKELKRTFLPHLASRNIYQNSYNEAQELLCLAGWTEK